MRYETHRDFEEYFSVTRFFTADHFHRSIEFMYPINADRVVKLSGKTITVLKGELLIVPPFVSHEYAECFSDCVHSVLPIEYSEIWEKHTLGKELIEPVLHDKELASDIVEHLKKIPTAKNRILKTGVYEYVLGRLLAECSFKKALKNSSPDFITDVLKYIDEHFNEDVTLELLSSKFGYSKYYFSNLFNKHFKMNLKTYLNRVRISKATTLLKKYNISKVSDMCGYNSLQSFFLNFKQVTGSTPGEYTKTGKSNLYHDSPTSI